jgi:hypothetical protein
VALIAALFGGLIAWRQWRTARNRLRLDLFCRRIVIYDKTRSFLGGILTSGRVMSGESVHFIHEAGPSKCLFNPELAAFLEEIGTKALHLESLQRQFEALTDDRHTERECNLEKRDELHKWLIAQNKEMDSRFTTFLRLSH